MFMTRMRRAGVERIASRSSGTSRCGITEVNQDPGPITIASACLTAATASGWAGGFSGTNLTDWTVARVLATVACPARVHSSSGASGSSPSTSASICRGTELIGSTLPRVLSSSPTMSRPATGSSSCCQRPAMSRFPMACPPSGPSPENLDWRTLAQRRPTWSSPHSAARAMRRSPGGRQPNSLRNLPEEPPSSATVTTAVSRSVIRRRAVRDVWSPCPPPKATIADPLGQLIPSPDPGATH